MPSDNQYFIDIDKIVGSRSGGKRIPKSAVWLLKKIIHIDFLNSVSCRGYEGVEFCKDTLECLDIELLVEGLEAIDNSEGKRYTIVSNHPLGGIDGVALGAVFGEYFGGKVKYLVNDLLMNVRGLAPLCVPINKIGAQSRNLPQLINEAYDSDDQMLVFPAGTCSRKVDGKIQDLEWGKSFITKSIASQRDIVPVHFIAQNSKRFYRIASLRKKLGIKFNIEMLLLPDEMYKARHSTFKVIIGKPVSYTQFDSSRTAFEWAQWMREKVYSL